jgi:putative SOS response-associated peptidase YedK
MCANYEPIREIERIRADLQGLFVNLPAWQPETWPQYLAPFIRRAPDVAHHQPEAQLGQFGLMPYWNRDVAFGRRTYNARSETAATKPAYRDAWKRGRRCVVPAEAIFEPNYETGKAVRWRIHRADGEPLYIAGLWDIWRAPNDAEVLSFTMLTTNADGHPFMRRFHKPDDEKRCVVILEPEEIDLWLDCPGNRMMEFMKLPADDLLVGQPSPLPPRGAR